MDDLTAQFFPEKHPRKVYSVSQVNRIAKETLENFSGWVHGEVAELEEVRTRFATNFQKFKLKDEVTNYTLPVILWPEVAKNSDFELKDGLQVLVFGNLTLYEKLGNYQFQARVIELFGEGLLQKKFEELKRKLRAEGLFDEKYKVEIPKFPIKIGVITSETGAAWTDFKKHTIDSFPFFEILLADVFVQGEQAVQDIVWAINKMAKVNVDVVVITRGGGTMEDLAAFNSEEVARAIFACQTPVICAIGHERDETIADWVADLRASTPTAAAKLITSNFEEFLLKSENFAQILKSQAEKFFQAQLLEISLLEKELDRKVIKFITEKENLLIDLDDNLKRIPGKIIDEKNKVLDGFYREFELLSPQRTLERGYSITYKMPNATILRNPKEAQIGKKVKIRLAKGELEAEVIKN